jgi:2-polyprenyl-3-methyl-5-hydroxy-6-metoxy-1,4-benzoquinol methylase
VSSAKVFEGTLEQSLLKNNCEIVICSEVIEHVIQQNEFVNALAKITTSKGTLILTTPNGRYYEPYVGYYQNKLEFQPVENWLNLNKLSRLFNQFFKIIKVTTFDLSFFYTRHSNVQRLKSFVRELRGGWRLWNVMERGFLTSAYFGLYYFAVMKRKV